MAKRYVVRDGKIYARITYLNSVGKERQLWRRAQSKSEAKELARDLAHSIKQFGTEALEHQLTLGDYLDKWLKSLRLSPRTHTAYETMLRLYVRPTLGNKKVTGIRPLDVQEMIDALNQRGLSPKTVREAHMVLSRSLKQAVRWRLIIFNPAQDAALPKKVRKEMKTLTPQQAQRFLTTAAKGPVRDHIQVCALDRNAPGRILRPSMERCGFESWNYYDPTGHALQLQRGRMVFQRAQDSAEQKKHTDSQALGQPAQTPSKQTA